MGMITTGVASWFDQRGTAQVGAADGAESAVKASVAQFERKVFYAGQSIFSEGQPGHEAYVVQTGEVRLTKRTATGDSVVLLTLGAGGLFGEMALVDDQPRSAAALATVDTTCIVIRKREFKAKLAEMTPWTQALVRILVDNLRSTTALVQNTTT